jgi:hypothetical protein
MDLLTWLLIVLGLGFARCLLLLVKMIGDLSRVSVHESPAIPETPSKPASVEVPPAKATEPYEWSPAEVRDSVSTITVPAMNSIATDNRPPVQCMAAFLVALRYQVRVAILTVGDVMERRFAEFACVPYQSRVSQQQWEELWEMEAER